MNIGLIVVGDEILSGKRQDKHMSRFIEILSARGMSLSWVEYVGDDRERLTATLRRAFASADLVVSCGGIGATPDDHTRQAAAAALGREMQLHPEARALIWRRVQQIAAERGEAVAEDHPDTLRRFEMGVFPVGAGIVPNPYNGIPGFHVGTVYFVPGFPVMAHPMMEWVLDEKHRDLHRRHGMREYSLILQGAMEATLTPLMERIEAEHAGIKVFSLPSVDHPTWGRHIELGVKAGPELPLTMLQAAYAELKKGLSQLGASICSEMVR